MRTSRKILFFVVGIVYLIIILYGLDTVYNVEATLHVKDAPAVVNPQNRIAIAHTEIFGALERPQVVFDHKKHAEAYKEEGCKVCHPVKKSADESEKLYFDFPKEVVKKDKTSVMEAFHDACVDCHKKESAGNKASGPVNCGDCHKEAEKSLVLKYPDVEFDFSVHDYHLMFGDCSICHHTGTTESCNYCHEVGKKRGPAYGAMTQYAAEQGLSVRRAYHQQCLNCHVSYGGRTECVKCHTGKYKTVSELKGVQRPNSGQQDKPYINIDNAKLKGVTFDHSYHETATKTCRSCHHESLSACKNCHDLVGKPEGNGVNIATAYHDPFSEHSCVGCHNKMKKEKECTGCHSNMPVAIGSMSSESCSTCHSGRIEGPLSRPALSTANLAVKGEVEVGVLEKEYGPATFPHLEIIKQLADISNKSRLANYFHRDMEVLCKGCHHRSSDAAEVMKDAPPYCRNCHTVTHSQQDMNKTTLLSAYHRQCLGCHEKMELKTGRTCSDCHKPKEGEPVQITDLQNKDVVKQNTGKKLNVWRPK